MLRRPREPPRGWGAVPAAAVPTWRGWARRHAMRAAQPAGSQRPGMAAGRVLAASGGGLQFQLRSSSASTAASLISGCLVAVSSVSCRPSQARAGAPALRPAGVFQLRLVAAAEVREPVRVVAVPLAQLARRRDVLAPLVEGRLGLGQSPRPDMVDQHPGAVARSGSSYTRRTRTFARPSPASPLRRFPSWPA